MVEDGDYVENQTIAEVDSDKAALELPAEQAGIISLRAEVGDVVAVRQIVCLIDTSASKRGFNLRKIKILKLKLQILTL